MWFELELKRVRKEGFAEGFAESFREIFPQWIADAQNILIAAMLEAGVSPYLIAETIGVSDETVAAAEKNMEWLLRRRIEVHLAAGMALSGQSAETIASQCGALSEEEIQRLQAVYRSETCDGAAQETAT